MAGEFILVAFTKEVLHRLQTWYAVMFKLDRNQSKKCRVIPVSETKPCKSCKMG